MRICIFAYVATALTVTGNNDDLKLVFPLMWDTKGMNIAAFTIMNNVERNPIRFISRIYTSRSKDVNYLRPNWNSPQDVVFGSWKYRYPSVNTPSSIVASGYTGQNPHSDFLGRTGISIKSPAIQSNYFSKLMSRVSLMQISLWFDVSLPYFSANKLNLVTGELILGGVNENRFDASTTVSFNLARLNNPNSLPSNWVTNEPVIIRTSASEKSWSLKVVFNPDKLETELPPAVFDEITKPLKLYSLEVTANETGIPLDIVHLVGEYSNEPIELFDCKDARYIADLHIGELIIPSKMMFIRQNADKCIFTLQRMSPEAKSVVIGMDLFRQFHWSLSFNEGERDLMRVSKSVLGTPPSRPIDPPKQKTCSNSGCICVIC